MAIAAPLVASHLLGPGPSLTAVLAALCSDMLAFGVVMGFGGKIDDRQTRASALLSQATYLRELLAGAEEADGAATMDRWLTCALDKRTGSR